MMVRGRGGEWESYGRCEAVGRVCEAKNDEPGGRGEDEWG